MSRSETWPSFGPFTWEDFVALDEDDFRELVNGELVEIEVPTWSHERVVASLIAVLGHWCWTTRAGNVVGSSYKIRIDDRQGMMPDVQLYRRGNVPSGQEKGLERGRPDLVVEVISPSSRSKDRVQKVHHYAAIGVPEYWLLDPEARTLERLVLSREGVYGLVEALEGGALFRPSGFDGLEIDLGRIWNDEDRVES
jgi:Uma2 family endonuclease